jgi:hypothetical protein
MQEDAIGKNSPTEEELWRSGLRRYLREGPLGPQRRFCGARCAPSCPPPAAAGCAAALYSCVFFFVFVFVFFFFVFFFLLRRAVEVVLRRVRFHGVLARKVLVPQPLSAAGRGGRVLQALGVASAGADVVPRNEAPSHLPAPAVGEAQLLPQLEPKGGNGRKHGVRIRGEMKNKKTEKKGKGGVGG